MSKNKEKSKNLAGDIAAGVAQDLALSMVAKTLIAPVTPVAAPLTEALHKGALRQTTNTLKKIGETTAIETAQALTKDEEPPTADVLAVKVLTNGRGSL